MVVEFDEAVGELDQRTGVDVPLDEMPPAECDAVPGGGRFQHVGVIVEADVAGRSFRMSSDPEPAFPVHPALVGPCEIEKREFTPAADGSVEDVRMGLGIERSRNGVSLTDAGRRFHDAVVGALAILRSAAAELVRSGYQPTKAEMNEEFEVNASMEKVGKALMQPINPRWIDKPRSRRK